VRRLLSLLGVGLLVALALLVIVLAEAHLEIRGIQPALPEAGELRALTQEAGGPVRISYVNTATHPGPGIAHTVFVLEWPDGGSFLIDSGMEAEEAIAFGRLGELVWGEAAVVPHGSAAEQLGDAVAEIRGMALTHLHWDHTGGMAGLCRVLGRPLPLFQTKWQTERDNFGTGPGRTDLEEAGCVEPEELRGGTLLAVPGFPGLRAIAAGGHTPGSTIYVAHVAGTLWVLSGDITNFKDSILEDRPKPWAYSAFVVPEARERLGVLRRWLRELDAESDFVVLPSHDLAALEASPMPVRSADLEGRR
jgi:glyoxylase-like metal-dependent hydrolase (beta-lactamase superfamily II)